MKFSIKDSFSKCDQIRSFLRIWSHLLKKFLMENFIFCTVPICLKFCRNFAFPQNFHTKKLGKISVFIQCYDIYLSVKPVRRQDFSISCFLVFRLHKEIHKQLPTNLRIHQKYTKMHAKIFLTFRHFSRRIY